MGYTTEFYGQFDLNRKLSKKRFEYLKKFAEIRHMRRIASSKILKNDPLRLAVKLPIGVEGEFFVNAGGKFGQGQDASIIDNNSYNSPPSTQPSLWCQWVPNEDGTAIEWDGNEKFYEYVNWLHYILDNFLIPWKYVLNGKVTWQGEDPSDSGKIVVKNNVVKVFKGRKVYKEAL